jgi:hypothetical protein
MQEAQFAIPLGEFKIKIKMEATFKNFFTV